MKKLIVLMALFLGMQLSAKYNSCIVVSAGWDGDGKGGIVDYLCDRGVDVDVRAQGGSSTGHRVNIDAGNVQKSVQNSTGTSNKENVFPNSTEKQDDINFVQSYTLLLLPVGVLHPNVQCYLTGGMVIDPFIFFEEIDYLAHKKISVDKRLWVSPRAHVVMPWHKILEQAMEEKGHVRTTRPSRSGTGPCYADKVQRVGIRIADLLDAQHFPKILENAVKRANELLKMYNIKPLKYEDVFKEYQQYGQRLRPYIKEDAEIEINQLLGQKKNIIFEGAQGTFLDGSLGTYPFVSASSTVAAGVCAGAGVGPSKIEHTLLLVKSHTTRTKRGPLPTKINDPKIVEQLKTANKKTDDVPDERRYGWLDMVMVREAIKLNGADSIAISKLDELDGLKEIKICIDYENKKTGQKKDSLPVIAHEFAEISPKYITLPGWQQSTSDAKKFSDLPPEARAFVKKVEAFAGIDVSYVSVGPNRSQMIVVENLLPF